MIVNPSFSDTKEKCHVPAGGTAGQLLTKKSAADFDAQWQDAPKAEGIPSGLIAMWSGAANKIPSGWVLCNGANGTPDLRNRFIVGAGSSYSVGATGGSESVTLTVEQMPMHNHAINGIDLMHIQEGKTAIRCMKDTQKNGSDYAGSNTPHENRPPYYALCFIMKT